eukprot:1159035-Prymnesium_polylepis.1
MRGNSARYPFYCEYNHTCGVIKVRLWQAQITSRATAQRRRRQHGVRSRGALLLAAPESIDRRAAHPRGAEGGRRARGQAGGQAAPPRRQRAAKASHVGFVQRGNGSRRDHAHGAGSAAEAVPSPRGHGRRPRHRRGERATSERARRTVGIEGRARAFARPGARVAAVVAARRAARGAAAASGEARGGRACGGRGGHGERLGALPRRAQAVQPAT